MIFIDANIFMYAAGRDSPQKEPCRKLLAKLLRAGSAAEYVTSTEVLQELLHRYHALRVPDKAYQLVDYILKIGVVVLPVELEDVLFARKIMQDNNGIGTRDAIHAAVALRKGIARIMSYDSDFDRILKIVRIQP
jgi:predicted nucleic acid-binding protein